MAEIDRTTADWKRHRASTPEGVKRIIASESGRASFSAEPALEVDGVMHFDVPNGTELQSENIESIPSERVVIEYFGGVATFDFEPPDYGGTDLTLRHKDLPQRIIITRPPDGSRSDCR